MSSSSTRYVTLVAVVVLVLTLPLTWQIVDVRAAQAGVGQQPPLVQQGTPTPRTASAEELTPQGTPPHDASSQVTSPHDTPSQASSPHDTPSQVPSPHDTPSQTPAVQSPTPQAPARQEPTPRTPADYDGDGIDDGTDRCPTRPETVNGFQDGDGCPDIVTTTRAS